jgi:hypothetical protein
MKLPALEMPSEDPEPRAGLETDGVAGHVPRARRYPVRLPIAVRPAADESWHPGTIANASRTGILFVSDTSWPPGTPIEMQFQLTGGSREGSGVRCAGVVVRSGTESDAHATAAVLRTYTFAGEAADFPNGHWPAGDPLGRKE